MDKLAVVILNYNGEHFLRQFLPSFLSHSDNHPIYVVDNASTDNSVNILKSEFQNVRLITLEDNSGYAGGYNQAIKKIEAEYIALVNSDIETTPNWLAPLISYLDQTPHCAAVQPKIKSYHNKQNFEYAGGSGGYLDSLGYPFCRGRVFDFEEEDQGQYDEIAELFWTSGACFVVRRAEFLHIGGFDTDYFAHMEEIDLCWRLKRKEWSLYSIPESTVYHVGGGTLSATNPRKTYLNFRNGLSLLVKNLPLIQFWKILIRIGLDWIAVLKFVGEGNGRHALSVVKAHFHFIGNFTRDFRKRQGSFPDLFQSQSKYTPSIVWKRYILGLRKFSEI